MSGQIQRQSSSYRHGLVLGLTMAEIMLLLVFCLLIAAAAVLAKQAAELHKAEELLADARFSQEADRQLVDELTKSPQLRDLLHRSAAGQRATEIDQYWRKLVEGRAVAEALEEQGLGAREAKASAAYLAEAEKLRRDGLNLAEARRNADLAEALRRAGLDTTDLDRVKEILSESVASKQGTGRDGHRWPPIIKLSEAEGYYFRSGRASLEPAFERLLRTSIANQLAAIVRDFDVDVVEVVGHTDEQPVGAKTSNLDRDMHGVLAKAADVDTLRPADNAGLGLARAVAVVGALSSDARFSGLKILPLSGAQLVQTDETLARGAMPGDVRERRRIEIRVRRSQAAIQSRGDAMR